MATKLEIATLYSATFNRAADAYGLNYWVNDGTNGTTNLTDLTDLAAAMTQSGEYQSLYSGMDRTATIETMYQNLFNRAPDTDGLAYWAEGGGSSIPINQMIIALIDGAQDTTAGNDLSTMTNKGSAGLQYAEAGLNDVEEAKAIMEGITDDDATVTNALHAQENFVQTNSVPAAFEFTADWLNGKILYDVDEYLNNNQILKDESTMAFTASTLDAVESISTDYTVHFDYDIVNGGIIHFTDTIEGRENYIKATNVLYDTNGQIEAIELAWKDTLDQALIANSQNSDLNTSSDQDYFVTDAANITKYEDIMQATLQAQLDIQTVGVSQDTQTTGEMSTAS